MNARDRLIVALDVPSAAEAMRLVDLLLDEVTFFKIGLQLFTAAGREIVNAVRRTDAKVFLDLKLHDIPNTVAKATAAAATLGVQMLTVHLSGGRAMLEAAVRAAGDEPLLLGVTVLTSANNETLRETGVSLAVEDQVAQLAKLGQAAGIRGIVCSPYEIELVRRNATNDVTIVTPGVRPSWAGADDQSRFMTPREALRRGADYLVIGRPITAHANPIEAAARVIEEMNEAPAVA